MSKEIVVHIQNGNLLSHKKNEILYLCEIIDVNNLFCVYLTNYVNQTIMLYTLNFYSPACQLHLNKTRKNRKENVIYPSFSWHHRGICVIERIQGGQAVLYSVQSANSLARWETWVWSLDWEDTLEESMTTHFSFLVWRIPIDRGAWRATVLWVTKSQTWLSD